MIKLVSMTCLCADIFDATGEILPGGEALNFAAAACGYAHVDMSIIGAVGDDDAGREILRSVKDKPIDVSCVHVIDGGQTGSNRTYLTPDGDRYYKPDSWQNGVYGTFRLSAPDIEKMSHADIVHTHFYCPSYKEILQLKERFGFQLSVDFDVIRDIDLLKQNAPYIDFFFISAASAPDDVLPMLKAFSKTYDGIFIGTLAEKGSVAYQHGTEYRADAVKVDEVIDTTGCGDSYQAGFICSYTRDGDITSAMNEGSRIAAKTLSHKGGFEYR